MNRNIHLFRKIAAALGLVALHLHTAACASTNLASSTPPTSSAASAAKSDQQPPSLTVLQPGSLLTFDPELFQAEACAVRIAQQPEQPVACNWMGATVLMQLGGRMRGTIATLNKPTDAHVHTDNGGKAFLQLGGESSFIVSQGKLHAPVGLICPSDKEIETFCEKGRLLLMSDSSNSKLSFGCALWDQAEQTDDEKRRFPIVQDALNARCIAPAGKTWTTQTSSVISR